MDLRLMVFDQSQFDTVHRVLTEAINVSIDANYAAKLSEFQEAMAQAVPMRIPTVNDWTRAKEQANRERDAIAMREREAIKSNEKARAILSFLGHDPGNPHRAATIAHVIKTNVKATRKLLDDLATRGMIRSVPGLQSGASWFQALEPVPEEDIDDDDSDDDMDPWDGW